MNARFWTLPGPAQFVEDVAADLNDGINVVVQMPAWAPAGLRQMLRRALGDSREWRTLEPRAGTPADEQVLAHLAPGMRRGLEPGVQALAELPDADGLVVCVEGLTRDVWPEWLAFLARYAHACQAVPPHARVVLMAIGSGLPRIVGPGSETCQVLRTWDGVVSSLDMLVYAASMFRQRDMGSHQGALLAAVAAKLAGWDPAVVDALVTAAPRGVLEPIGCLQGLARARQWATDEEFLWEAGQVGQTDGVRQVHSAAVALSGDVRQIRDRIWSAETAVLLPLIEQRRQEVIDRVRPLLSLPFDTPFGRVTDVRDLEVAHLAAQLRDATLPTPIRSLVGRLRRIRNALAHHEAVLVEDALSADVYRSIAL